MRRSQSKSRGKSQDRPLETLNNTPGTTSKTSITTLVMILQNNRAACEERPESPPAKKPAPTGQTPPAKSLSRTTDMGGEEKMGQNSAIDGGHGITKQAGTSEDNASGDLELWLLLQPEVGRSLVEKLDGSLDTAQPGTITAPNWQQREGESADGTYEGQYIEMPCLVVLPSDDDNEVENINVQFPISSITKEPLQSTSGADMGGLAANRRQTS
ncbi:hypothetical protein MRX96_014991 [Rhipicephalus microplus]